MGFRPSVRSRWLDTGQVLSLRVYEVEVHKLAKKEGGQYPASSTEKAWSIKDLFGFGMNFSCGTRRVVSSGQDSFILLARVAQS